MKKIILFSFFLSLCHLNFSAEYTEYRDSQLPVKAAQAQNPEDESFLDGIRRKIRLVTEPLPVPQKKYEVLKKELDEKFPNFSDGFKHNVAVCILRPRHPDCKGVNNETINSIKHLMTLVEEDVPQHLVNQAAKTCAAQPAQPNQFQQHRDRMKKDAKDAQAAMAQDEAIKAAAAAQSEQIDSDMNEDKPKFEQLTDQDKIYLTQIVQKGTEQANAESAKIGKILAEIKKRQQPLIDAEEKRQQDEAVEKIAEKAEAFGVGAGIAARLLGHKDAGRKLKAFGKQTKVAMKGCYAMASGDWLTGGMAIFDAIETLADTFEDKEDHAQDQLAEIHQSILAAIEQAVKILSEQMKENTEKIIDNIDDFKRMFSQHCCETMAQFFELSAGQKNISKAIDDIREKIHQNQNLIAQTLHQQGQLAAQRHAEIGSLFAELPTSEIDVKYHEFDSRLQQGEMSAEFFSEIIKNYHLFITQTAARASLTGSYITDQDLARMTEAFSNVRANPSDCNVVCQHLDTLVRLYEKMLPVKINANLKEGICNPLILNKCIMQLNKLLKSFLKSGHAQFSDAKAQKMCLQYLNDIHKKQDNSRLTVAWMLDQDFAKNTLLLYQQTVKTLSEQYKKYEQEEFLKKTREQIKDRLREIAEGEKRTISYIPCSNFEEFKANITAVDASIHTSLVAVSKNCAQGSDYPVVSRNPLPYENPRDPNRRVIFNYHGALVPQAETIEAELRNDDLAAGGIATMLKAKQQHWSAIQQDLLKRIDDHLVEHCKRVDALDCVGIQPKHLQVMHSIVYPADSVKNKLWLVAPGMLDATPEAQALVDTGQATLRYTYRAEEKHLIITALLKRKDTHIETENMSWKTSDHTAELSSDEQIYNMWYGGRYCKDAQDAVTVSYGGMASPLDRHCVFSPNKYYAKCPEDAAARVIATRPYPLLTVHAGMCTYKKPLTCIHVDNSKQAEDIKKAEGFFAKQRRDVAREFANGLNDQSSGVGEITNQHNALNAMICAYLALGDQTCQPHLALVKSNPGARTSNELWQLLRKDCTQVIPAFNQLEKLCAEPVQINGPRQVMQEQIRGLQKLAKRITQCTGLTIAVPRPIAPGIPEEVLARLKGTEDAVKDMKGGLTGVTREVTNLADKFSKDLDALKVAVLGAIASQKP
jgi:hypothetical protein